MVSDQREAVDRLLQLSVSRDPAKTRKSRGEYQRVQRRGRHHQPCLALQIMRSVLHLFEPCPLKLQRLHKISVEACIRQNSIRAASSFCCTSCS